MKKSVIGSILAIAAALFCVLGLVGCEGKSADYLPEIDSGWITSNIGLERSWTLNQSNGKYANLYVENNGSNSIVATINGQNERIFQAGEKGGIYLEVTQAIFGGDQPYEFKVVPGTNGGAISIYYEIAQRDEWTPAEQTINAKS